MICSKCGLENSDNAKFCRQCGNPLKSPEAEASEAIVEIAEESVAPEATEVHTEEAVSSEQTDNGNENVTEISAEDAFVDVITDTTKEQPCEDAAYDKTEMLKPEDALVNHATVVSNEPDNFDKTEILKPEEDAAYVSAPTAPDSTPVYDKQPTYHKEALRYEGIGGVVKKCARSALSFLSGLFFTVSLAVFILYMLTVDPFNLVYIPAIRYTILAVFGIPGILIFFGLWISFFSSFGRQKPHTLGISIIRFSTALFTAVSAIGLGALVFYLIFTVVLSGTGSFASYYVHILVCIAILIFNLIFCSRIIVNCTKAKEAEKYEAFSGKASVLLPILCILVAIAATALAVVFIMYSSSLLNIISIISFALSALMSGITAFIFRSRIEKAKI